MATWRANSPHGFEIGEVSLGTAAASWQVSSATPVKKVPLKVNLSVHGPFRALIQMAKGFKGPDERSSSPSFPSRCDTPGLTTETRVLKKEEEQQLKRSTHPGAGGCVHKTPAKRVSR